MTKTIASVTLLALAACCGAGQDSTNNPASATKSAGVAYFAGGCFWGVEHFMEAIDGVTSVESGYMGGDVKTPTYEQVSRKKTGHLETVRVRFDPQKVSYEKLARRFFEIHDPTQANGQGPDIGPQYHSAIFYSSPAQKQIAEQLIEELVTLGYDVVTEVRPAGRFWKAEEYHQNYYARTDKQPYCHIPVMRFEHGPQT